MKGTSAPSVFCMTSTLSELDQMMVRLPNDFYSRSLAVLGLPSTVLCFLLPCLCISSIKYSSHPCLSHAIFCITVPLLPSFWMLSCASLSTQSNPTTAAFHLKLGHTGTSELFLVNSPTTRPCRPHCSPKTNSPPPRTHLNWNKMRHLQPHGFTTRPPGRQSTA